MICWKCGCTIPEGEDYYVQKTENQPTLTLCICCEAAHGWIFSDLEYVAPKKSEIDHDFLYIGLQE